MEALSPVLCAVRAAPQCKHDPSRPDPTGGACHACSEFLVELDRLAAGRLPTRGMPGAAALPSLLTTLEYAARRAAIFELQVARRVPGPRCRAQKTVASDGAHTVSGFRRILPAAAQVSPEQVRALARRIGHRLVAVDSHDYRRGDGWSGCFYASHAEKQLAVVVPDEPLVVSQPMCMDCRRFFSRLAVARQHVQIVGDPITIRFFLANGMTREIRRRRARW